MRVSTIARTIGLFAVTAAIAASAVNLRHAAPSPTGVVVAAPADPLTQELARCNTLGIAAKDDARCQAAWAANRLRFFAPFLTRLSGPAANPEPRVAK